MNKARVAASVVVAVILMIQRPVAGAQTAQNQTGSTACANDIQDPAECHAYMTALNSRDPWQKGPLLEAFANQYPQSLVLIDALRQAVVAYESIGNKAKTAEVLNRIFEPMPSDVRDLAVTVALGRAEVELGKNPMEHCSDAQAGLQRLQDWPKPEGTKDSNFKKMRKLMSDISYVAAGLCALKKKDYVSARAFYEKAFQLDPTNARDVWQLTIADLEMNPIDVNGLSYCAKAISLAEEQNQKTGVVGANEMARYCKAKYEKYHGSLDGWDRIVRAATRENAPPSPHLLVKK